MRLQNLKIDYFPPSLNQTIIKYCEVGAVLIRLVLFCLIYLNRLRWLWSCSFCLLYSFKKSSPLCFVQTDVKDVCRCCGLLHKFACVSLERFRIGNNVNTQTDAFKSVCFSLNVPHMEPWSRWTLMMCATPVSWGQEIVAIIYMDLPKQEKCCDEFWYLLQRLDDRVRIWHK